jgi:hypothetical protein
MAGKPQNRLELRRQYEAAEPLDPMEDESEEVADVEDDDDEERKPKKKKVAKAKATKPKTPKAAKAAARVRIVWAVVTDAFKTVGTFDYNQKEAALARAAELTARGKSSHFVQRVKEPIADNAPGLGAGLPRPAPTTIVAAPTKPTKGAVEDDEEIEDEDMDIEADDEGDDEDEE